MRTWAEINFNHLNHNISMIKKYSNGKDVIGVIKADAYGMGAVKVGKNLVENGVKLLAVACFVEALELYNANIDADILILGCTPFEDMEESIKLGFHLSINSKEEVDFLEKNNLNPKIHLVIDSGMGRVGFSSEEGLSIINYLKEKHIGEVIGIYTHLSVADDKSEDIYTKAQIDMFKVFENMTDIKYRHILNSAGSTRFGNETATNYVRAGLLLHGVLPFIGEEQDSFKSVFKLKTKVLYKKKLKKRKFISYGKTYHGEIGDTIVTLPAGYADGYDRRFSNCGIVSIGGVQCPVIGKVCMDMCMVKIPREIEDSVNIGTEVTLIGDDISIQAENIGTIAYELMTGIGKRVKRVYIK